MTSSIDVTVLLYKHKKDVITYVTIVSIDATVFLYKQQKVVIE
jgi:hypothetical protein